MFGNQFSKPVFHYSIRYLIVWIKNALYKKYLLKNFWHERSAFQSVPVQAVDWRDNSEPLLPSSVPVPVGKLS